MCYVMILSEAVTLVDHFTSGFTPLFVVVFFPDPTVLEMRIFFSHFFGVSGWVCLFACFGMGRRFGVSMF